MECEALTIKLKISRIITFDVWHNKKWGSISSHARFDDFIFLIGWTLFLYCQLHFITLFDREHTIHLMQIIDTMAKAEAANLSFRTETTTFSSMQRERKKVLHDVNATFYDKNNVNAHKRIDFVERLSLSFYEDATFCPTAAVDGSKIFFFGFFVNFMECTSTFFFAPHRRSLILCNKHKNFLKIYAHNSPTHWFSTVSCILWLNFSWNMMLARDFKRFDTMNQALSCICVSVNVDWNSLLILLFGRNSC